MTEDGKNEVTEVASENGQKTRRTFVKTAAQVAVTAPAVAVLLNATTTPASAQTAGYAAISHILDDFTFGNNQEDIDALAVGSNFGAGFNNAPLLDDVFVPPIP